MALTALLNLINSNVTQQGSSDRITGTEVRTVLTAIVNTIQGDISFSTAIPFDKVISKMATHQLVANVTLTPNTSGAVPGFGTVVRIIGGGSFSLNLSAFKKSSVSGSFVATSGTVNVFMFVYDGTDYWYSVFQEAGTSSGATQLATPTVSVTTGTAIPVGISWAAVANATGYRVIRATNGSLSENMVILANSQAGTTFSDNTAVAGNTYYYGVQALGNGTTYSDSSYGSVSVTPAAGNITPAAPTAGTVNDTLDTFDFTYSSGYTTVSEYEYTLDGGSTVAALTAKPLAVGDVAKAIGQVGVRVKAATGRNASAWLFNASAFTVAQTGTPLNTPSATATPLSNTEIKIDWTDVPNEDGYTVQIATDAGFTTGVQTASKAIAAMTHTFSGLTANTLYHWRVKAEGSGTYADSAYSSGSTKTTTDLFGVSGAMYDWNAESGVDNTADGGAVTSWTDALRGMVLSGAATYDTDAGNGKPAIVFNGSTDRLINAAFTMKQPYTAIIIAKIDADDTNGSVLFDSYNNVQHVFHVEPGGTVRFASAGGSTTIASNTGTNYRGAFRFWGLACYNDLSIMSVGGDDFVPSGEIGLAQLDGISVGALRGTPGPLDAAYGLKGPIPRMIFFNKLLTQTEINTIRSAVATPYATV